VVHRGPAAPWIRAAVEAGHVRSLCIVGKPLAPPITADETVVGLRRCHVIVDGVDRPGHCAIVVRTFALPAAHLDDETVETIAEALAEALLAEVM
jgi:hypothetical protein